ncbi:MAG: hypothetical protein AAF485_31420, partial [Chloroflexota bacterium]
IVRAHRLKIRRFPAGSRTNQTTSDYPSPCSPQLKYPTHLVGFVVTSPEGNLRLFDLSGFPLGSVGFLGDAPGQFNEPVDVLRDPFGAYFVTEGANIRRWQRVDAFGRPLNTWAFDTPVAFNGSHMAWAPDGSILMTHSGRGTIIQFAPDGTMLEEWGILDTIDLNQPVGIFFDEVQSQLFISDIGARVVHIFQADLIGEPPKP